MKLPQLYAIVDAQTLQARRIDLRTFAEELREAGVSLVQWRCKQGSPQEVLAGAAVLREVFAGSGCRLMMNDRADLALLAKFDGVHVGQGDLPVADARLVLETVNRQRQEREGGAEDLPRGLVGVSTHGEEQVRAADQTETDYVAIGPVLQTQTKADAEPAIGLDGVRRARALTTKPLVAIGGITLENAASILAAGADSIAVVTGLLVDGQTVKATARQFLAIHPR